MVADDERMRRITSKRLDNEALKEQARRASIATSDNVWKSCLQSMPRSSTMTPTDQSKKQDNIALKLDYWSEDEMDDIGSSDDNSSDERKALEKTSGTPENDAVIRRRNRGGSRELNESLLLPDADTPEHEFDSPTLSEAHPHHENDRRTDATNKRREKWTLNILRRRRSRRRIKMTAENDPIKRIFYKKQQKQKRISKDGTDTSECEAWTCDVCGMAFSSELSAAKYEKDHIEQLIQYLGYSKDQKRRPMNGTDVLISPKELSERIDHRIHDNTAADLNNNMTHSEKNNDDTEFRISSNLDGLNHESEFPSLPAITSNLSDTKSKEKNQKTVALIDSTTLALGSNEEAVLPAIPVIQRKSSLRKLAQLNEYPGLDADIPDLPLDAMILSRSNRTRTRSNSEVHFDNNNQIFPISSSEREENDIMESQNHSDVLLFSKEMRYHVIRADEALVDVILRVEPLVLTQTEQAAEYELALLARDKRYYDDISARCVGRHIDPTSRFRSDNKSALGKMQNKLVDAYQLMKDSDGKGKGFYDQYSSKRKRNSGDGNGGDDSTAVLSNNEKTLYVNVMVKNNVQVVKHELQRLAKKRWESDNAEGDDRPTRISSQFELVRGMAQTNIVKLAYFIRNGTTGTPLLNWHVFCQNAKNKHERKSKRLQYKKRFYYLDALCIAASVVTFVTYFPMWTSSFVLRALPINLPSTSLIGATRHQKLNYFIPKGLANHPTILGKITTKMSSTVLHAVLPTASPDEIRMMFILLATDRQEGAISAAAATTDGLTVASIVGFSLLAVPIVNGLRSYLNKQDLEKDKIEIETRLTMKKDRVTLLEQRTNDLLALTFVLMTVTTSNVLFDSFVPYGARSVFAAEKAQQMFVARNDGANDVLNIDRSLKAQGLQTDVDREIDVPTPSTFSNANTVTEKEQTKFLNEINLGSDQLNGEIMVARGKYPLESNKNMFSTLLSSWDEGHPLESNKNMFSTLLSSWEEGSVAAAEKVDFETTGKRSPKNSGNDQNVIIAESDRLLSTMKDELKSVTYEESDVLVQGTIENERSKLQSTLDNTMNDLNDFNMKGVVAVKKLDAESRRTMENIISYANEKNARIQETIDIETEKLRLTLAILNKELDSALSSTRDFAFGKEDKGAAPADLKVLADSRIKVLNSKTFNAETNNAKPTLSKESLTKVEVHAFDKVSLSNEHKPFLVSELKRPSDREARSLASVSNENGGKFGLDYASPLITPRNLFATFTSSDNEASATIEKAPGPVISDELYEGKQSRLKDSAIAVNIKVERQVGSDLESNEETVTEPSSQDAFKILSLVKEANRIEKAMIESKYLDSSFTKGNTDFRGKTGSDVIQPDFQDENVFNTESFSKSETVDTNILADELESKTTNTLSMITSTKSNTHAGTNEGNVVQLDQTKNFDDGYFNTKDSTENDVGQADIFDKIDANNGYVASKKSDPNAKVTKETLVDEVKSELSDVVVSLIPTETKTETSMTDEIVRSAEKLGRDGAIAVDIDGADSGTKQSGALKSERHVGSDLESNEETVTEPSAQDDLKILSLVKEANRIENVMTELKRLDSSSTKGLADFKGKTGSDVIQPDFQVENVFNAESFSKSEKFDTNIIADELESKTTNILSMITSTKLNTHAGTNEGDVVQLDQTSNFDDVYFSTKDSTENDVGQADIFDKIDANNGYVASIKSDPNAKVTKETFVDKMESALSDVVVTLITPETITKTSMTYDIIQSA